MPSINKRVHTLIKASYGKIDLIYLEYEWLAILNANISQQKSFSDFHLIWSFDRTMQIKSWHRNCLFCMEQSINILSI